MMEIRERVLAATQFLKRELPLSPRFTILSFLGVEPFLPSVRVHAEIAHDDIPGFPVSHPGEARLFCAESAGQGVLFIDAGPLPYEGRTLAEACVPVWVMARLGCRALVLINAVLGLNASYRAGELFLASDHLDFFDDHPLQGHLHSELGPRFPDMSAVYDPGLVTALSGIAAREGMAIRHGVIAGRRGPASETPAELRFLHSAGADAVARSVVPEAITARHAGVRVAALSAITEVKVPPHRTPTDLDLMVAASEQAARRLAFLLSRFLEEPGELRR
ncbi:MAG: purine-nucleoside phosphorylase [Planctomycetota bacterium]